MQELVSRLRQEFFRALEPLLPIEAPVALVDLPNHANVGDSAIYLGELAWLQAVGAPAPAYVCDIYSYREADLRARVPRGTILIQGGGNLGDLWTYHQALREQILANFPEHRVIQLPQSVHFDSAAALERAAALFSRHPRLTVCARDHASRAFVETRLGCPAVLCPDAAFALGPLPRPLAPSDPLVALVREDKESSGGTLPEGMQPSDWLQEDDTTLLRLERWLRNRDRGLWVRNALRPRLAARRLDRGCRALSRGRRVVTDRLHAHILCLLMDIPHVVVDNSYGKVRSFVETWTAGTPGVQFCRDWAEASAALAGAGPEAA